MVARFLELHLIMDGFYTRKHPNVEALLAATRGSRCTSPDLQFLAEPWSRSGSPSCKCQAIHCTMRPHLIIKIRRSSTVWKGCCQPVTWTKTSKHILTKAAVK
jgi:hypothetical protein